jgi:phosphatidylinositol alpha-1,6-mannosyltransferase
MAKLVSWSTHMIISCWQARLDQLLGDPALAREMGKRGCDHVTQHFGSDVARATLRSALEL